MSLSSSGVVPVPGRANGFGPRKCLSLFLQHFDGKVEQMLGVSASQVERERADLFSKHNTANISRRISLSVKHLSSKVLGSAPLQ